MAVNWQYILTEHRCRHSPGPLKRLCLLLCDHLHSMSLSLKIPLPVEGARASFEPDKARWRSIGQLQHLIAHHAPFQYGVTISVYAICSWTHSWRYQFLEPMFAMTTSFVGATSVNARWGQSIPLSGDPNTVASMRR